MLLFCKNIPEHSTNSLMPFWTSPEPDNASAELFLGTYDSIHTKKELPAAITPGQTWILMPDTLSGIVRFPAPPPAISVDTKMLMFDWEAASTVGDSTIQ